MTDKQTMQMQKIMQRIKHRREELNLSFQQLADLTGMSKSTLQRYETGGIKNIPLDKLEVLATALKTTPEWILGWDRKITDIDKSVIALYPGFVPGETYLNELEEQYIWVNVHGDSMSPLIDNGSEILVKKQDSVDSGQIGVVLIDDEEAVVKKITYGKDWIELVSINPYYPPRRFEGEDIQLVRVLGLVKEVSKSLQ